MVPLNQPEPIGCSATLTIRELEQSKTDVVNTLASQHSRRSYENAMERFIAWYCSEPLTFNRSTLGQLRISFIGAVAQTTVRARLCWRVWRETIGSCP
jgi:hypothetical protein